MCSETIGYNREDEDGGEEGTRERKERRQGKRARGREGKLTRTERRNDRRKGAQATAI